MRSAQGGTQMYCPHCEQVRVCEAISTTQLGKPSGQRWFKTNHQDLQWFRRGRRCLTCRNGFLTAEVDEDFLDELVELRTALAQIKSNAEDYITQSAAASESLARLTRSLNLLRALRIYQDADDLNDKSVSDLGLSAPARAALCLDGISNIGDLRRRTAAELHEVNNSGEATLCEVRNRLAELGLRLHGE